MADVVGPWEDTELRFRSPQRLPRSGSEVGSGSQLLCGVLLGKKLANAVYTAPGRLLEV